MGALIFSFPVAIRNLRALDLSMAGANVSKVY